MPKEQLEKKLEPGYIEAQNMKTGKKLWGVVVYRIHYNLKLESDKQMYFITSIEIKNGKLMVITERESEKYEIDLVTHQVTRLK